MRYLPLTPDDRRAMLAKIGAADVDALFRDVPEAALAPLSAFDLPDTQGELEVERALSSWRPGMSQRVPRPSFAARVLTNTMCPARWII